MKFNFLKKSVSAPVAPSVIALQPQGPVRGNVLLSYIIAPFLLKENEPMPHGHSNFWECFQMASTFLKFGYAVDVINYDNNRFIPQKKYSFFIDIHQNIERLHTLLGPDCVKILHATGGYWMFANQAEYARIAALRERREISLLPRRQAQPTLSALFADKITYLGNEATVKTFEFAQKPCFRIPISVPVEFPWTNEDGRARGVLWFGSAGMVHKGLDWVLEAFTAMPDQHLFVCGLMEHEPDFVQAYRKELRETPNIHCMGWMDIKSAAFADVLKQCGAVILPSCSEGGGGSVIQCMHAGLVPIVTEQASVDIGDFGLPIRPENIDGVRQAVRTFSAWPDSERKARSFKSREHARANHTQKAFAQNYEIFVREILGVSSTS